MKILLIHNDYQQPGGERTAVEAQIRLLQQQGHQVVLYTQNSSTIQHYNLRNKVLFFPTTVFSCKTYNQIHGLIQQERPAVAHVHNVFPLISPAVYRALNEAGVPIIQTIHNFRFLCPNGLFYTHGQICERCKYGNTLHAVRWQCYKDSYPLSALYALTVGLHRHWDTFQLIDRFIALTEFTAQKLVESNLTTREKISVLGNFISDPLPSPGSFERRERYVVYLGRLSPEKGVEFLIEAIANLPDVGLKILGDGPHAEALQALVSHLGLSHVKFLGHVNGEEKWKILQQASATIVPSIWYENFPFTVLESLAVGTPVIASDLGSLPYVIKNGKSGLLFQPANVADLRAKLRWISDHPREALAMGQHAREMVERRFTSTVHYQKLMHIYDEVAA